VLKILKKKDDTISLLQQQLNESTKMLQVRQDLNEAAVETKSDQAGRSKDYFSGRRRDVDGDGAVDGGGFSSLSEKRYLEDALADCRRREEQEVQAHSRCKLQLLETQKAFDELRIRSRAGDDTLSYTNHHQNELRGLREKTLDQAEQIEVHMNVHVSSTYETN
jgi:hypothetical protein